MYMHVTYAFVSEWNHSIRVEVGFMIMVAEIFCYKELSNFRCILVRDKKPFHAFIHMQDYHRKDILHLYM